jgi:hypothetical protein
MMTERRLRSLLAPLRRYSGTFLSCILVLWYGLQPGAGFVCFAVMLGIFLCSPHILSNVLKRGETRKRSLVRCGSWCATAAAILVYHSVLVRQMQSDAAEISARIESYAAQHEGKYPASVEKTGVFAASPVSRLLHYSVNVNAPDKAGTQPFLFYRSNWIIFEGYFYNFDSHQWEFRPD